CSPPCESRQAERLRVRCRVGPGSLSGSETAAYSPQGYAAQDQEGMPQWRGSTPGELYCIRGGKPSALLRSTYALSAWHGRGLALRICPFHSCPVISVPLVSVRWPGGSPPS